MGTTPKCSNSLGCLKCITRLSISYKQKPFDIVNILYNKVLMTLLWQYLPITLNKKSIGFYGYFTIPYYEAISCKCILTCKQWSMPPTSLRVTVDFCTTKSTNNNTNTRISLTHMHTQTHTHTHIHTHVQIHTHIKCTSCFSCSCSLQVFLFLGCFSLK